VASDIRARFGLEAARAILKHAMADERRVYVERGLTKTAT
jgi:hypothetical protein